LCACFAGTGGAVRLLVSAHSAGRRSRREGPGAEARASRRHTWSEALPHGERKACTPGFNHRHGCARAQHRRLCMKFDWHNNRDFFAGLLYIVVGTTAMWMARDYPFGSALRMGPGYFPTVLGGMMIAFGIAVLLMGVANNEKIKGGLSWRALIVLPLSTFVFGWVMEEWGFIPAMVILVPLSAASGNEFKWSEIILLT